MSRIRRPALSLPLLASLALPLTVACAVPIGADPNEVDLGPWDAGSVTALQIEATDGTVVLSGSAGRSELSLGPGSEIASTSHQAGGLTIVASGDIQLLAPADLSWGVTTVGGDISASGMAGTGYLVTDSGEVVATDLSGDLSVQVDDAAPVGVHLESLPPGGVVVVEANLGPISLDLPADTSATLSASTGSGVVEVTGVDFDGVLLDESAEGILGDGDGSLRLVTGGGDISVNGFGR